MNAETVRNPDEIMNAQAESRNPEKLKAILRAANTSKLRYPLLVFTLLLLAAVAITARHLAQGILADVEPLFEMLSTSL